MKRFYTVIINNYQKGAKLGITPTDKIVLLKQIDRNHHKVVYALDSEDSFTRDFITRCLGKKLQPATMEDVKEAMNAKSSSNIPT